MQRQNSTEPDSDRKDLHVVSEQVLWSMHSNPLYWLYSVVYFATYSEQFHKWVEFPLIRYCRAIPNCSTWYLESSLLFSCLTSFMANSFSLVLVSVFLSVNSSSWSSVLIGICLWGTVASSYSLRWIFSSFCFPSWDVSYSILSS